MQSRQNILIRVRELKNYRFSGYIRQLSNDSHVIRLCVLDFERAGYHSGVCIQDFVVTECEGFLSAVSVNGQLVVERLS